MDVRRSKRRGSIFDLTVFETDLCVRVDWECLEHESVADLDLSCAIYDRKVGASCSRTFSAFVPSYLSPFVRACDAGDLSGPRASVCCVPYPCCVVVGLQGECLEVIDFSRCVDE